MTKRMKTAYSLLIVSTLLLSMGVSMLGVGNTYAARRNVAHWNTVVQPVGTLTSNCLVPGGQYILLGEMPEAGFVDLEIGFQAERPVSAALKSRVLDGNRDYLDAELSVEEIALDEGEALTIELYLTAKDDAEELEEALDVDVLVTLTMDDGQVLEGTFRITLPAVVVEEPEPEIPEEPVNPEPPEGGEPTDPETPEGGEPTDPENPEGGDPTDPETPEGGEPTEPEPPEGGEPTDPENPEGGEPTDPENPEGGDPTEPENPEGGEPTDPENPEGGEPTEPENPESGNPTEPENPEGDEPTEPENPEGDNPNESETPGGGENTEAEDSAKPETEEEQNESVLEKVMTFFSRVRYSRGRSALTLSGNRTVSEEDQTGTDSEESGSVENSEPDPGTTTPDEKETNTDPEPTDPEVGDGSGDEDGSSEGVPPSADGTSGEEGSGDDTTGDDPANPDDTTGDGTTDPETPDSGENSGSSDDGEDDEDEPEVPTITYDDLEMSTLEYFSLKGTLPIAMKLPEDCTGLSVKLDDEEDLPKFIRYSVDEGETWYMLYYGGEITIDLEEVELVRTAKGSSLLLDLSYTEWERVDTVYIFVTAYTEDVWYEGEVYSTPEALLFDSRGSRTPMLLTPEKDLVLAISESWAECEKRTVLEYFSEQEDGSFLYEEVTGEEITVDFSDSFMIISANGERPRAGTYRLQVQYSYSGIAFATSKITFFVNYSGDTVLDSLGGTER